MPMPMMTAVIDFSEATDSERIPHTFLLFKNTSLGHLQRIVLSVSVVRARATETPANSERIPRCWGEIRGRAMTENVRFFPFSDDQDLPSLPFPAVCSSAITIAPS